MRLKVSKVQRACRGLEGATQCLSCPPDFVTSGGTDTGGRETERKSWENEEAGLRAGLLVCLSRTRKTDPAVTDHLASRGLPLGSALVRVGLVEPTRRTHNQQAG